MFDESSFDKKDRAETRPPTDLVCLILSSTGIDHKTKASSLIRSTKFANASGKVKLVVVFFSAELNLFTSNLSVKSLFTNTKAQL